MSRPDLRVAIRAATQDAVREAAEHVLREAQKNVPVDDGELRDSGEIATSGTQATITFTARHAKKQHEDMRLHHPNGGGPKFLEKAMGSEQNEIRRIVATAIRQRLG